MTLEKLFKIFHARLIPLLLGCFGLLIFINVLLPVSIPFSFLAIASCVAIGLTILNIVGYFYLLDSQDDTFGLNRSLFLLILVIFLIAGVFTFSTALTVPIVCFMLTFSTIVIQPFIIKSDSDSVVKEVNQDSSSYEILRYYFKKQIRTQNCSFKLLGLGSFCFVTIGILAIIGSTSLVSIILSIIALTVFFGIVLRSSLFRPDHLFFSAISPIGYKLSTPLKISMDHLLKDEKINNVVNSKNNAEVFKKELRQALEEERMVATGN